jgi:imidazole glycerol phosphate synthase subunit HisF
MTIDPATGLITWTPDYSDVGEHSVSVMVEDGRGGSAVQDYIITVEHLNGPPQITSSPILTATAHAQYDALYLFDEANGLTAYDSSGSDYDGSILGAAYTADTPFDYPGNAALSFDGVDDYVDLGDIDDFEDIPQITYEMWVNPSDFQYNCMISKYDSYIRYGGIILVLRDGGKLEFSMYESDSSSNRLIVQTSSAVIQEQGWYHVAFTFDGSQPDYQDKSKIYLNGIEQILSYFDADPYPPTIVPNVDHTLKIGATRHSNGDTHHFSGLMDEVAIYRRALTAGEIVYDATHSLHESVYIYSVDATDPDGDTLTYSLTVFPEGMTMDSATGLIQWTPSEAQVGSHDVTVEVSDGRSGTASQSFTVEVEVINNPPIITSIPVTTGTEGVQYTYDVDAEDADGDTPTYSLSVSPEGMAIDPATGLIQWMPSGAQSGSHDVAVEVSDGKGGTDTQSFTVTVEEAINTPPTITSTPPTAAREGEQYTYDVQAFDADGDTLLFFLTEFPEGIAMDSNIGIITWIPSGTDAGLYDVTIVVSDGRGGTDGQSFIIEVEEAINNPPVITSMPSTAATLGILYTYQVQAMDEDGDQLTYNFTSGPMGMVIDANNGLISWQPWGAAGQDVSLTVSDGKGGTATQEFTIEINQMPTITSAPVTTATEGVLYAYDVNGEDADGDTLTFSLILFPSGMTIDTATGVINWIPSATQSGQYTVTVQIDDGRGGVNTQTFTITVAEAINVNPQITSEPKLDANNNFLYVYDVEATDADGDTLTFSLITSPSGMTIDGSTGLINWTPSGLQAGTHSVTVQVSDGRGGTDIQPFSITVSANAGPVITSVPVKTAVEGSLYSYDVNARDKEDDPITHTLTTAPVGMAIDQNTGLITWTPSSIAVGVHNITVTVSDGRGGTTGQSYDLTVLAISAIPQIDVVVTGPDESGVFTYQYQITGGNNAPAAIYDIFILITAPILDVTVPIGWDHITDNLYFVHLFSTDPQFDIFAGQILPGFIITSPIGPRDITCYVLGEDGNLLAFTIDGP